MIFVLGILILLGFLVTGVMLQVRGTDSLSHRDHLEAQREALLESALSYCRMRWKADSLLGPEEWSEMVWLEPHRAGFRVNVRPWGALVRVDARLFVGRDTDLVRTVVVGGSARGDSMPCLGILDGGQNLQILQGSSLRGTYWGNGSVSGSFGGTSSQFAARPDLWSPNPALMPRTDVVEAWWTGADHAWYLGAPIDSGLSFSRWSTDTCDVTGDVRDAEFRCDGVLRIRDAKLLHVVSLSRRLLVEGKVEAKDVLFASRTNLLIRGDLHLEGQILSKDSLLLLADTVDARGGLFHLLGAAHPNPAFPGDSISSSIVRIGTRRGTGTVVYAGRHQGSSSRQMHFLSDSAMTWKGVWICRGGAEIRGKVQGSVLAQFLLYHDQKGVPWEGRLDQANLSSVADSTMVIAIPWTGRGEPASWSVR